MNLSGLVLKHTLSARSEPVWNGSDFKKTLLGYSNNKLQGPEWVTGKQLTELFNCTRQTLNNWQREYGFPKGITEQNHSVTLYFNLLEVQTWINQALTGVSINSNPDRPIRPSEGFLAAKQTPVQRDQELWCTSMEKAIAKHIKLHKHCNLPQHVHEVYILKLN